MPRHRPTRVILGLAAWACTLSAVAAPPAELFTRYCGDCHAGGAMEGSLAIDQLLAAADPTNDRPKWVAVWKNLRAQLMPPADQPQPTADEKRQILSWLEQDVFQLDPAKPDPGRVTLRRLNRMEYRYSIQDLFEIDFDPAETFPADDTGYGFDTIGDVLSLSPLQVEKYLEAAREVTTRAIPLAEPQPPSTDVYGDNFRAADNEEKTAKSMPLAEGVTLVRKQNIEHPGPYRFRLEYRVSGADTTTAQRADLVIRINDQAVHREPLKWLADNDPTLRFEGSLMAGANHISLEMIPQSPPAEGEAALTFRLRKLTLTGPTDGSHVVYPESYRRIFFEGPPPNDPMARAAYARAVLRRVVDRAYRRPVDEPTLDKLVALAAQFDEPGVKFGFERGVAEALTAVLASPRFLFRAEAQPHPDDQHEVVPLDEFALAARLSYFLWSSLPDEELYQLASKGELRANLRPQVDRMLADGKFQRFVRRFVGQWLRAGDVETIGIDARRILGVKRLEESFVIFNANLRRSMREETELLFSHLVKENRSLLDLLVPDYTFANESLANWYGLEGIKGNDMRQVPLPPESPRGGILTHASFLIVTSNPRRTSPVKRGLYVLDNILGTPAPPPPPNVPPLEESKERDEKLSMRELMVRHREDPLCASCHERMDPLGLALEEYDALGRWRKDDQGVAIETAGELITGEKFANVKELSRIIANERRNDFYLCVTDKLMTYALGRGMEYYDAPAIDHIVDQLHADGGSMRTLLYGVIESPPFQLRRGEGGQ